MSSLHLQGSTQENHGFEYFVRNTGRDLCRSFELTYLYNLMLQMSHSDPAMRSVVIALGSTGEKLHTCGSLTIGRERSDKQIHFTRMQYGKAIRLLRDRIDGKTDISAAHAIIFCFLLCIFEFLQGNDSASLLHLNSGLALLSEDSPSLARGLEALLPHMDLQIEITHIFSAMNAQATLWLGLDIIPSASFLLPQLQPLMPSGQIYGRDGISQPTTFSSVDEAADSLNHHTSHFYDFRLSVAAFDRRSSSVLIPDSLYAEKQRLILQFQQWPPAVEALISSSDISPEVDSLGRIAVMKMNWTICHILLHTLLVESRWIYRKYEADFSKVLTLAASVIRPMNDLARLKIQRIVTANNRGCHPGTFSLHAGLIAPIYYTAIKCRNLKICQDALTLLSEDPWREGAWESLIMATIAEPQIRRHREEGYYNLDNGVTC
ncbi:hypothetical protein G7Y79_00012g031950 [Physcia stellaris]|nr:hypothetical protein G7Y79_00012g031950 [Physcia stellaris]